MQTTTTPQKKVPKGFKIFFGVTISIIVLFIFIIIKSNAKYESSLTPQQRDSIANQKVIDSAQAAMADRNEKLDKGFNHGKYLLKTALKENMNDPDSFEEAQANYVLLTDTTMKINLAYRGKNVFGAMILKNASAIALLDGTLLKIDN